MELLEAAKDKFAMHFGDDHPHVTSCAKILERCKKLQQEAEGDGSISISGTAPSDPAGNDPSKAESKAIDVNHEKTRSSCCILF